MEKYVYPAVFTRENDGYSIEFPDIEGCYTCADTLGEAMLNAKDVMELMLYQLEEKSTLPPTPSDITSIKTEGNSFTTLIYGDTLAYRKMFNGKSVKKTLTIPGWLNELAQEKKLNFSQILQEALAQKLNV